MMARASSPPRGSRLAKPGRAAILAFVIGSAAAGLAPLWQVQINEALAAKHFVTLAQRTVDQLRDRLAIYDDGVRSARGAVLGAGYEHIDRERFRLYSESIELAREFPGALGMGVIRRVPVADEAAFVAAARREGMPDFAIRQLSPHSGERYVIEYIEPVERNRQAVGVDIASDAVRRVAAQTAMRTGRATLSAPLTLLQARDKPQRSFLLLLPIYRPRATLNTPEAREAATLGWSFAPLVIDEVLADLEHDQFWWLALRDMAQPDAAAFVTSPGRQRALGPGLVRRVQIPIYGRTWEAEIRATPAFLADLNLRDPRAVAAAGLALAVLFAGLVYVYTLSAQSALQVRAEQARRAAIVASSSDAVIGETLDGIIIDWNQGAERLFRYTAEQALGCTAASLVLPAARVAEDEQIRAAIARGEQVPPFDTTRQRADGTLVDVSVAASPIVAADGRRIGFAKTIRDISVAKRAEHRVKELNADLERQVLERTALLEAARRDLRNILDAVPSLISYWDRTLHNRFANRAYHAWFGLDPARIPGMHARELLGELLGELSELILPRMEAALRGEPQLLEITLPRPGESGTRNAVAHFVPDVVDGETRGFYVIVFDMTEQTRDKARLSAALRENEALLTAAKQTEKQLRASQTFLDRAGEVAGVGAWQLDLDTQRVTWSAQMHRIYEVDTSYEPGTEDTRRFFGPDAREVIDQAAREAIRDGKHWNLELPLISAKGRSRWVRTVGEVEHENGRAVRLVGSLQDITERKQIEAELQATYARMLETSSLLSSVLESASEVSIIATNPLLVITVWNRGAERLLGYASEEVVGRATPLVIHDAAEVDARCQELSRLAGVPVLSGAALIHPLALREPREWTYVRKDGGRLTVSLVVTAMVGDDGEIFGYLGVAHDVTRQKQYEASLRVAMLKAEQASQAKSEFLANMSHEIRTPMNAVLGLTYLLGQTPLDSEQAAFLSKVRTASKSLLGVINDILDLSKIEAGEVVLERVSFDLRSLLGELRDVMLVHADAKRIAFEVDAPGNLPAVLDGDPIRLNQILTNLLSNAIKFTDAGSVRLRVRQETISASSVALRFEVEDTGIGIPEELQPRLFAPFAQADASTTRRFGGTGLGLSIVKRLAKLMGGDVGVVSRSGEGSQFWVRVELGLGSALPERAPDPELAPGPCKLLGVRLLVVDDSDINRDVAQRILELEGAKVALASNGQEAFERLQATPNAFDIVLMDVQMPVLDGREATRRIRAELNLSELPVIALTADARISERQRASAASMDDFVSKPFEPAALVECIRRHLPPDTGSLGRSSSEPAKGAQTTEGWPAIEGIDADDAQVRLANDVVLFRSLLGRMLDEFSSVVLDAGTDASKLETQAANMHKLRGAAGQLGAKEICELAADAELACRSGHAKQAAQLCRRLSVQLERLRYSAAQLLRPTGLVVEAVAPQRAAVDPASIADLLELLKAQSLSALERFDECAAELRHSLGDVAFEQMQTHVRNLRFVEAARILGDVFAPEVARVSEVALSQRPAS